MQTDTEDFIRDDVETVDWVDRPWLPSSLFAEPTDREDEDYEYEYVYEEEVAEETPHQYQVYDQVTFSSEARNLGSAGQLRLL